MKLTLNPELKWITMDKDGCIYLYKERPDGKVCNRWNGERRNGITSRLFNIPDLGPWEDSLHEILPDGTLRKYVPDIPVDTKVLVGYKGDKVLNIKAHFAKFDEHGMWCWFDGKTSFTTSDIICWNQWKLCEEGKE